MKWYIIYFKYFNCVYKLLNEKSNVLDNYILHYIRMREVVIHIYETMGQNLSASLLKLIFWVISNICSLSLQIKYKCIFNIK